MRARSGHPARRPGGLGPESSPPESLPLDGADVAEQGEVARRLGNRSDAVVDGCWLVGGVVLTQVRQRPAAIAPGGTESVVARVIGSEAAMEDTARHVGDNAVDLRDRRADQQCQLAAAGHSPDGQEMVVQPGLGTYPLDGVLEVLERDVHQAPRQSMATEIRQG